MNLSITGVVVLVSDEQVFESGLKKKFVTVKTVSEYPDVFDIDFINDNMAKLDAVKKGQLKTFKVRMSGREVESKDDKEKKYRIVSLTGYDVAKYE
jgi:Protein of unknown function (DUF3127).